jgi:hypothetical protein
MRTLFLALVTPFLVILTACGTDDSACLELAEVECGCCEASRVEACKQAARAANERNPPPEEGNSACEATLEQWGSCADLSQQQLEPICDGTAFK